MRPFLCTLCQILINLVSESEVDINSTLSHKLRLFQKFQRLIFLKYTFLNHCEIPVNCLLQINVCIGKIKKLVDVGKTQ